ncbi:MAG: YdcF family protein [Nitrospinae bacterium]|nr:YdcF family protein [Nitrospinota bacterium]
MIYIKKLLKIAAAITAAVVLLAALFHTPLLNALAGSLVRNDALRRADAIVVLTGDRNGDRMAEGIRLYKEGLGAYIVFWGGQIYWKYNYADLLLGQLKESGIGSEHVAYSTREIMPYSSEGEARENIRTLKSRGAKSFILVTSHYHTARAGRVYDRLAAESGMAVIVHPADDSLVHIHGWWKDHDSAKMIYLELQKALWYRLAGLFGGG